MKIRMKADISGVRDGHPWPRRGETVEVPDHQGADLCASGLAEPVADTDADAEKAVSPESEKRTVTTDSASGVAKKTGTRKSAARKPTDG